MSRGYHSIDELQEEDTVDNMRDKDDKKYLMIKNFQFTDL